MKTKNESYIFRDLTKLTQWLKFFLTGCLVLNLIDIFSDYLTYDVLKKAQAGFYVSHELLTDAIDHNEIREGIIGLMRMILLLITGFSFLRWTYYANKNARALGATEMQFTPRWSILWYFIPIWYLWKPYQVMKEIWKCSQDPLAWQSVKTPILLRWWWAWWILCNFIDQISMRLTFRAKEIPELMNAAIVDGIADFFSIPLDIIAILLITQIFSMQMTKNAHLTH